MPIFPKRCAYCFTPTDSTKKFSAYASEVTKTYIIGNEVTSRYGIVELPVCPECQFKIIDGDTSKSKRSKASLIIAFISSLIFFAYLYGLNESFDISLFVVSGVVGLIVWGLMEIILRIINTNKHHLSIDGWGHLQNDGTFYFNNTEFQKEYEKMNRNYI